MSVIGIETEDLEGLDLTGTERVDSPVDLLRSGSKITDVASLAMGRSLTSVSAVDMHPQAEELAVPEDPASVVKRRGLSVKWPHPWQLVAIVLMFLATTYWLIMLKRRDHVLAPHVEEFESVLRDSCIVFALCCSLDFFTFAFLPGLEHRYIFVHFSIGMVQQLTYFISFCTDDFLSIWRPTYFGCYMYCIFMLILLPDKLFLMFRIFYTVHHTLSFFITGTWMIITDEPWNDYLVRGVMLWLTSDFYVYVLNVFRCLCGRNLSVDLLARLQLACFVVERIHRSSSYISAIVATSFELNKLDWVVFATGLANDAVDVFFQLRSIRSRFVEARKSKGEDSAKPASKHAASSSSTSSSSSEDDPVTASSMFHVLAAPHHHTPSTLQLDSPFNRPFKELLALLQDETFSKKSQWELSAWDLQKLSCARLRLLAGTRLFRNSLAPGSGASPEDQGKFRSFLESVHFIGMYDMSLFDVVGVHAIGGNIVFIHGNDAQLAQLREEVDGIENVYCFGATEIGHGSNLKALRTFAELDIKTDEWVLQTPDDMANKYWIGNTTFVGDIVMVLALLRIGTEDFGHHWFRVPLWSDSAHQHRYPGVVVRDVGVKPGCNGIGNGCLQFCGVRVPRSALMQRFAQVEEGGVYTSSLTKDERFLRCIQTFVLERLGVATAAVGSAKAALYIALSYATHRKQFGPPGGPEIPLLAYSLHRQRLLPHVARLFSIKAVVERLGHSAVRFFKPYHFDIDRKTMHALSCMVKAFGCWDAFRGAQEARECCGGHGFVGTGHIGMIRNDLDVTLTFAGDNTLLALEVVRFSLKGLQGWPLVKKLAGPLRPVLWSLSSSMLRHPRQLLARVEAVLIYREETMLWKLARELRGASNQFERFTAKGMDIREAARALYDRMSVEAWMQCIKSSELMDLIGMLDALSRLQQNAAWFLADGVMSGRTYSTLGSMTATLCDRLAEHVDELLESLHVPAELVVDWPLVHPDYCQRLSKLALVIDEPAAVKASI